MMALAGVVFANSAPVVSNVTASQRSDGSRLVDIYYDLAETDGNSCTVCVDVSDDGGSSWSVRAVSFSGAVGEGIAAGAGKHIIWDCPVELPGVYGSSYKVRVTGVDGQVPSDMVLICGGEFDMGDHHDEMPWSLPIHAVYVDPFYMGRYETTNQQYCDYLNLAYSQNLIEVRDGGIVYAAGGGADAYCNTNEYDLESRISFDGSTFTVALGKEEHPMVEVSWYGGAAYCDFYGYCLPTEAQWEYAARGGNDNPYYRYPWGDIEHGSKANYWESGDAYETGPWPWTTPVGYYDGGQRPPGSDMANDYGLYDMAGNAWEWCNDWHSSGYYSSSPYYNPQGPASGTHRALRGGCWSSCSTPCRVACRPCGLPDYRYCSGGFRVVMDANFGRADSGLFTVANRDIWYVDNDASNDPEPNNPGISDPNEDGSAEHPFDAIQEAIDVAGASQTIIVLRGIYSGEGNRDIDFGGKGITVRSESGPVDCVIDCEGTEGEHHRGFYFHCGESALSVVEGFTIRGGYASSGGGMQNDHACPTVRDCVFAGNTAERYGGGIDNYYSSSMLINCLFTGNGAGYGGAAVNWYGSPEFANCTFCGNGAGVSGGGVFNYESSATIRNCILWGDTPEEIHVDGGSASVTYSDVEGGWMGEGNIDSEPCFVNGDNGDYRLLAGSACIDAGDPNYVAGPNEADLDGHTRVADGDCNGIAIVDMGGYEFGYAYMGDLNGDCRVDCRDFAILAGQWLQQPGGWSADIAPSGGDGVVEWRDLGVLAENWLAAL